MGAGKGGRTHVCIIIIGAPLRLVGTHANALFSNAQRSSMSPHPAPYSMMRAAIAIAGGRKMDASAATGQRASRGSRTEQCSFSGLLLPESPG